MPRRAETSLDVITSVRVSGRGIASTAVSVPCTREAGRDIRPGGRLITDRLAHNRFRVVPEEVGHACTRAFPSSGVLVLLGGLVPRWYPACQLETTPEGTPLRS